MRRALVSLLLVALTLASGCAGVAVRPQPLPQDLAQLDRWQAIGRIGVSGPEAGGSGSFEWSQRGERAQVQIRGPVGVGGVHLEFGGDGPKPDLHLQTSDGQSLQSDAAWSELEARLGADVPAGQLRYWLLGLAAPGEHRWLQSPDGEHATLEQGGWRIDYQRYSSEPGLRVPVRLRAVSGEARVRIVVDRWRLGQ
ncbi:MAG TPA: lipoprotein insertase outer membrane protein LolB [Steroidobacter sp.]|jgi:outer membrane lipoprotein LolB|nr:lipoprotein insertase outer membrane protein LolB [Steroidobacter sp.]